MNSVDDDDTSDRDWESVSLRSAPIPLEQLVQDVYAGSEPQTQEHMLAQLVGKVYEAAPVPVQTRLLEQLLRPVGVLALIVIANGVFGKICLRGGLPDTALSPDDVQTVRPGDVVALAEHVLHTSGEALNGLSHLLVSSPALAGSAAATALLSLLLQRSQHRRSSDDVAADARRA
ncbi:MAG: hypothetical protein V4858_07895 [Pseudomonadota bacterium]